jgi:hypothetical protein
MTTRWTPPLPTIGRAGPRIEVLQSTSLLQRLEEYYCERRSVPDIFECRVPSHCLARFLRRRDAPVFLSDLRPGEQQSVLLRNLYFKISAASRSKMRRELDRGRLNHVRSWFHTANAVLLPLLLTREVEPSYYEMDALTAWALESCAHNYALFQRQLKTLKKQMRKSFALHGDFDHVRAEREMFPYLRAAQRSWRDFSSPAEIGRFVLTWCQTRATGMADNQMMVDSLEKFERTVSDPGVNVTLDPEVLRKVTRFAAGAHAETAKVSAGTTSCLESTRAEGGKTAYLSKLARRRVVSREYNLETLESTEVEPRPVRSAKDVLNWAVDTLVKKPVYSACVRVHVVSEPSKARTITVAPYAYQVVMGVFAHYFQPAMRDRRIRSGMKQHCSKSSTKYLYV